MESHGDPTNTIIHVNSEAEMFDVYKTNLHNSPIKLNEILIHIFSYLSANFVVLHSVSKVCRSWRERTSNLPQWKHVCRDESITTRDGVFQRLQTKYLLKHPPPPPFYKRRWFRLTMLISSIVVFLVVLIVPLAVLLPIEPDDSTSVFSFAPYDGIKTFSNFRIDLWTSNHVADNAVQYVANNAVQLFTTNGTPAQDITINPIPTIPNGVYLSLYGWKLTNNNGIAVIGTWSESNPNQVWIMTGSGGVYQFESYGDPGKVLCAPKLAEGTRLTIKSPNTAGPFKYWKSMKNSRFSSPSNYRPTIHHGLLASITVVDYSIRQFFADFRWIFVSMPWYTPNTYELRVNDSNTPGKLLTYDFDSFVFSADIPLQFGTGVYGTGDRTQIFSITETSITAIGAASK
eukprot:PhF_6_TR15963/c0_g2_i4/m.24908